MGWNKHFGSVRMIRRIAQQQTLAGRNFHTTPQGEHGYRGNRFLGFGCQTLFVPQLSKLFKIVE